MKRVAVIISSHEMVRSYLHSEVFRPSSEVLHIDLWLPEELEVTPHQTRFFKSIYRFHHVENDSRIFFFFEVLRARYASRSKSFRSREERFYPPVNFFFKRWQNTNIISLSGLGIETKIQRDLKQKIVRNFNRVKKFYRFFSKYIARKFVIRVCSKGILFRILIALCRVDRIHNLDLLSKFESKRYDLIVYPTNNQEILGLDIPLISSQLGIESQFIVDNWDNLSSKSPMWRKPNYLSTWGPQSTYHAISISGINQDTIFELGSARFTSYFMDKIDDTQTDFPQKYILFLGSFLRFDELEVLKKIDKIVDEVPNFYGYRVIYRPHPEGTHKLQFNQRDYRNVDLDFEMTKLILDRQIKISGNLSNFSLENYPKLFKQAKFVIGGLTSMLIEATLFGKIYISLEHDEPFNLSNPLLLRDKYTHFFELDRLSNLMPCRDLSDLKALMLIALEKSGDSILENCLSEVSFFVNSDLSGYPDRLRENLIRLTSN